jgi:hypothetical protein
VATSVSNYDPSPEALRILMDTFWTPQGWRRDRAWPSPDAMRIAVDAGVMFSARRTEDHDGWVKAARAASASLSTREVGDAFLASLTSRRLDLRSALGSYAVARFLPEHAIELAPHDYRCLVCGDSTSPGDPPEDMNVLSFERFKWGGVRRDKIMYIAFDLEQFARAPRLAPSDADIDLGQRLIDQLRRLPDETPAAKAASHLKMIKGNKAERDVLVGILGVTGILQTAEHPAYAKAFVRLKDRELPGRRFVDQAYPACWWTAADGVNAEALKIFLPQLT